MAIEKVALAGALENIWMSHHDLLATAPIFRDLDEEERDRITKICEPADLGPGDTLFEAGTPGESLYLIALGTIEMTLPGKEMRFARFGTGQLFGVVALLLDEGYPGRAVAVEATRLARIRASALRALLDSDPVLAAKFYRSVARHLAFHTRGLAAELENPYF
jgi:CBS domain-containing protein